MHSYNMNSRGEATGGHCEVGNSMDEAAEGHCEVESSSYEAAGRSL